MNATPTSAAQQRFDLAYISAYEIQKRLNVNRCAVTFAHQRGMLPAPILVGAGTHVWERAVTEPLLEQWAAQLKVHRERSA